MTEIALDPDVLWTTDLAVGCAALDQRNRQMLEELSRATSVIAASEPAWLAEWLVARLDQFDVLLREEEAELAAADYPELAVHQGLHDHVRSILRATRNQLHQPQTAATLADLARSSCESLARWLPRHVVEADRLFGPYVDVRYRGA